MVGTLHGGDLRGGDPAWWGPCVVGTCMVGTLLGSLGSCQRSSISPSPFLRVCLLFSVFLYLSVSVSSSDSRYWELTVPVPEG